MSERNDWIDRENALEGELAEKAIETEVLNAEVSSLNAESRTLKQRILVQDFKMEELEKEKNERILQQRNNFQESESALACQHVVIAPVTLVVELAISSKKDLP
jgi:small-conductance mechanosensitive channel